MSPAELVEKGASVRYPGWEEKLRYVHFVADTCRNHVFGMAFDSPVGRNLSDTMPKGYPFFEKRPPLSHGYFEAFNRDRV